MHAAPAGYEDIAVGGTRPRKAHHHCHLARADSHKPWPNQTPDGHGGR
jgi:hypothetical protein